MAALIGQAVADWARTEHTMAMVLAAMLGKNPAAGVALFATLRNARAQRDAIAAVADVVLSGSKNEIFHAVIAVYMTMGKVRNSLAHGIFGWSWDIPGVLLWVSSSDQANYEAELWFKTVDPKLERKDWTHAELEKKIFVYQIEDLQEVVSDIKETKLAIFDLYCIIRHGHEEHAEQYQKLIERPHVARELARLRQGR